jgi:hypothetical protein
MTPAAETALEESRAAILALERTGLPDQPSAVCGDLLDCASLRHDERSRETGRRPGPGGGDRRRSHSSHEHPGDAHWDDFAEPQLS